MSARNIIDQMISGADDLAGCLVTDPFQQDNDDIPTCLIFVLTLSANKMMNGFEMATGRMSEYPSDDVWLVRCNE